MNKQGPGRIEWCDFSWSPIVGCTKNCPWCYARRQAKRFKHQCQKCYDFVPHLHPERLGQPAKRKKPARIFVCSMGDLFDPLTEIQEPRHASQGPIHLRVLCAMDDARQHTFIVLTKRPDQMVTRLAARGMSFEPRPNWHLLVSITNQADADERIPELLKLRKYGWPVLGVSYEPALNHVDFTRFDKLDWIILGAQTGPGKRNPYLGAMICASLLMNRPDAPLFIKDSVGWPETIREYPREGE